MAAIGADPKPDIGVGDRLGLGLGLRLGLGVGLGPGLQVGLGLEDPHLVEPAQPLTLPTDSTETKTKLDLGSDLLPQPPRLDPHLALDA